MFHFYRKTKLRKMIKLTSLNRLALKASNYVQARHFTQSSVLFNKADSNAENWKEELQNTMQIFLNFVSPEEEKSLLEEIEPYMKRLRYERSHWDNAIHAYRETERSHWNENNLKIINRIRAKAFPKEMSQLPLIHILDLAPEGWIKPHVDSTRFCGDIIAGLSLLSDSVMRLTMVENEATRAQDVLLPQRSLYIMSGAARYNYNHEILKTEESYFEGRHVPKNRRISIICRCQPNRDT